MRYQGRHRAVSAPTHRLRRSSTVAALAVGALVAPLVASGPVASQATTTAPTYDTLASHPKWRLSAADATVAAQIADLKRTLNERGVTYDPAAVAAYRVPTIDGYTTYVTAKPETMRVKPNPDLLERTPEGVTALSPTDVAVNYGADTNAMAAIEEVQRVVAQYTTTALDLDLAGTVLEIKNLIGSLDISGVDPVVTRVTALVEQVRAAAYEEAMQAVARINAALDRPLPEPNALIQQIIDAIRPLDLTGVDETVTAAEQLIASLELMDRIGQLIIMVKTLDPMDFVNQVKALAESLPIPTVDPNQVVALVTKLVTGISLGDLGAFAAMKMDNSPLGAVYEVIPLAAAAPPDLLANVMANPNVPGPDNENDPSRWSTRNKDCFHVVADYFDRYVCWSIEGQDRDNNADNNYWQLHTDVSGHSISRKMEKMWAEAKPSPEGASNQRMDGIPEPRAAYGGSTGCTTDGREFSISSGSPIQVGFGWYWERTTCETYEPKTYRDDGHWASIWWGNPLAHPKAQRAIMLKVPVRTPYDKGVCWQLLTGQWTRY